MSTNQLERIKERLTTMRTSAVFLGEPADEVVKQLIRIIEMQSEALDELKNGKSEAGMTYGMYQVEQVAYKTLTQVESMLGGANG